LVLLSILKLALVALNTIVIALLVIAVAVFDQRAAYRLCQLWAWTNLAICGLRVRVRRLAALDPTTPYVFMSNHRSQYDILAVVFALPEFQMRWVAKKELTRIPFFGWALKRAGHVVIDRSDSAQAVASLRAARTQMLEGISVVIFPEGTRSTAGEALLPLKKGGFMLALETGFPIVPICVRGSGDILPRGSWLPVAGEVEVVVGEPIAVAGAERDELMQRVRAFMLEELGPPRETPRPSVAAEAV
jgi:1-acyl-sn-glycerol-3-phosphate acyltransferase